MTAAQQLDVVKVEHHHIIGIWHVVLRRRPGAHQSIDLYLTSSECAAYGIDLPNGDDR